MVRVAATDGIVVLVTKPPRVSRPSLGADQPLGEHRHGRWIATPASIIQHSGGDADLADSLRAALMGLGESDEGRAALELGAIQRFDAVADADYAPVRAADATR